MMLPQNQAISQADLVCVMCNTEFKSLAMQCQSCKRCHHPTCAEMPLYYMVKYARLTIKFQWKQCTEQLVEPHWTDTGHLFRDLYNNGTNIGNPHNLNDTIVPSEENRIESQTHNIEEMPNERQKNKEHKVMINKKLIC